MTFQKLILVNESEFESGCSGYARTQFSLSGPEGHLREVKILNW